MQILKIKKEFQPISHINRPLRLTAEAPPGKASHAGDTAWRTNATLGGDTEQLFRQVFHEDPADTPLYAEHFFGFTRWDSSGDDSLKLNPVH